MDGTIEVTVAGNAVKVAAGTRPLDLSGQPAGTLACALNGETIDLKRPLTSGGHIEYLTFSTSAGRRVFRHSSAHLLAQAVKRLWPQAKLGTGPALEDGFYYDILLPEPLQDDALAKIEQVMADLVRENLEIQRLELSREQALELFSERGESFKLEIIDRIPEGATISAYRQGEFIDLCSGPHLPSTGLIGAIRLTNASGAYWRGVESNPMLTRIYGTSFPDDQQLAEFFERQEEAKRRDHRKLGRELDLVSFHEEAPGFPFWHPKGQTLYRTLENYSRTLQERRGYQEVSTPWIYRVGLWQKSGHWDHYRENIFVVDREDELMGLKPMNCPGHALLFGSTTRSYRDLPMRVAEYGPLSRYERSGTLHGLFRVRGFHQDDAHLFVSEDQIAEEMEGVLELVDIVYRAVGMPYEVVISTRPDDYMGELALWDKAEAELESVLITHHLNYQLNPKDGAFYGPKLDFYAVDALGRRWQCATVQLDFQTPVQFDLNYIDREGQPRRPVMIHRAIMGSLERFLGILIEHYAGAFPMWLAPEQVRVIPITDHQVAYAEAIQQALIARNLRVAVDSSNQKLGYKVRAGQLAKTPIMLVVGGRDQDNQTVSVRDRELGDLGARPWPAYGDELEAMAALPLR
ncbi:MAG: threonine--tRNA ligase [Firmicutes bacterium]|nr:threonine--tRNA ligase [Bacillota bacterium]MCL5063963.1 threonine--tRNA ligase [Bacillota bacterium]